MSIRSAVYNKDIINNKALCATIGVLFFILVTALGAYVRIPVQGSPVPITLQTFFVLLAGAVLGRKLGGMSQIGYVLMGSLGLPLFQGAAFGAAYLVGPTFGYLIGFIFAAFMIGRLIERANNNLMGIIAVFAAGSGAIYAFGMAWLMVMYKMSFMAALTAGAMPFVPGDAAKIMLAAVLYRAISKRSGEIFSA